MIGKLENICRRAIYASAKNAALYRALWHPMIRVCALAQREHQRQILQISEREVQAAEKHFATKSEVLAGPFRGLRYPVFKAAGSAVFPKLIGSYEAELHGIIKYALTQHYTDFVDIGCAEGYYAVGWAMQKPSVHVWAFDNNPTALELCANMASLNGVNDRITLNSWCDADVLRQLPITGKALILCDCEGFERRLFSAALCKAMAAHDFLIEIHDFIDPRISCELADRFSATHSVKRIRSIPDLLRPQLLRFSEIEGFSEPTQIALLAEMRPMQMEWFYCRSRD